MRFTHYYFSIVDAVLGPMVMRIASFLPFTATYYINAHSYIETQLKEGSIPLRKMFLRACDIGLIRMTASTTSQLVGRRITKRIKGKLCTTLATFDHCFHVFRTYFKHSFLKQYQKCNTFLRNEIVCNDLIDFDLISLLAKPVPLARTTVPGIKLDSKR